MGDPRVLIAGAGPTGLVLALRLARHGVPFRLVDRATGPGTASRAIAVHARTLEYHAQIGLADEAVRRGMKIGALHLREGAQEVASFALGDIGEGLSPYPFVLSLPQDQHEALLNEALAARGHRVEWGTELVDMQEEDGAVHATLKRGGRGETAAYDYVVGCDGAHSRVRQALGLEFAGGTYEQRFFVADTRATGPAANGEFNIVLSATDFCAVLPVRGPGTFRVLGIVPDELKKKEELTYDDVRPFVRERAALDVSGVNWFSSYHVHHRVAGHFRKGRCFIAGDAGHIHSPAGGQGMNTGIGDAVNLSWKLAHVLAGRAQPALLDSYEPERIGFARTLVATTDTAFKAMVSRSFAGQLFRTTVMPHLLPFVLGFSAMRRQWFRTLSQVRVNYRGSPLSSGEAGEVAGGDRLPWVPSAPGDNFEPLKTVDWQVHVYGAAPAGFGAELERCGVPLHVRPFDAHAHDVGLAEHAAYAVRPDGYVGLAQARPDAAAIREYLAR